MDPLVDIFLQKSLVIHTQTRDTNLITEDYICLILLGSL